MNMKILKCGKEVMEVVTRSIWPSGDCVSDKWCFFINIEDVHSLGLENNEGWIKTNIDLKSNFKKYGFNIDGATTGMMDYKKGNLYWSLLIRVSRLDYLDIHSLYLNRDLILDPVDIFLIDDPFYGMEV